MLLIDTNVLYKLAGIETDKRIDITKLELYLKAKDVCISPITIFEILNSEHFRDKYSFIIKSAINKCRTVSFVSTSYYDLFFDSKMLIDLELKDFDYQQNIKMEIGKLVTEIYSYFYSNIITSLIISYFMVFPYLDEYSLDEYDDYKNEFQVCYDMLFEKMLPYLKLHFSTQIKKNDFTEKKRNNLFDYIIKKAIFFFSKYTNDLIISIDINKNFSFSKMFTKLKSAIKKYEPSKEIKNPRFNYFENYDFINYVSGGDEKNKENAIKVIYKFVDILTKYGRLFNGVTEKLYEKYLFYFMIQGRKTSNNDLIDSSLIDVMNIVEVESLIDEILTFDNKFESSLNSVKMSEIKIISSSLFERKQ